MRDTQVALGNRVVVTGLAGSGKSTFSLALAATTGLPVIHLDLHFWKSGWVAPSETEWREKQQQVLAGDAWIADGNYHETLDLRLDLADTIVLLDLPWWLCSFRAVLRGFRMPGELPEGCEYSRWQRLRDEWRLAVRIGSKDRSQPKQEREIIAKHRSNMIVHELRSERAVSDLLNASAVNRTAGDDP